MYSVYKSVPVRLSISRQPVNDIQQLLHALHDSATSSMLIYKVILKIMLKSIRDSAFKVQMAQLVQKCLNLC